MTRARVATRRERDERGFALLLVLLVMALVAVVSAEFAYSMRLEAAAVRAYKNGIIGTHLAETAIEQAIREIVADAPYVVKRKTASSPSTRADRRALPRLKRRRSELDGGHYSYRITDEEARININANNANATGCIDRLLQALGSRKKSRDTIIDSIQDWRDPNGEHRVNGAESDDYYLKLPMPYRARNANLESITELLQIKGITPAIYNGTKEHPGLASLVTVRGNAVNINTAGAMVLTALGYSSAEIIQIEQSRRNNGPYTSVPTTFTRGGLIHVTQTFRVEAEGIVDDRVAARLTAIVQKRADGDQSVAVLEWSGSR